jgi:hypothetical protein
MVQLPTSRLSRSSTGSVVIEPFHSRESDTSLSRRNPRFPSSNGHAAENGRSLPDLVPALVDLGTKASARDAVALVKMFKDFPPGAKKTN